MNFYLGNQYSYISNSGAVFESEKKYFWEDKNTFNHIAPIIESRLAKLSKIKPAANVKPASSSDNDIYSAKLAKSILNNNFETNDFYNLVSTATHWSEITGTAFYKITWEPEMGNIIGLSENKTIKNGDVKISVCSPFEIFPNSNTVQDVNDCDSIIHAKMVSTNYIYSKWGRCVDGENLEGCEITNYSFGTNLFGVSNGKKLIHKETSDNVLLIERYEKPNAKNPNGKLTIVCKDTLLYDGDMPYIMGSNQERTYPFVKQVSIKQVSIFWGLSVIERCIPIQKAYNNLKNKKHEYISRLASGILTVEDGSVDIDNLESDGLEPGKILIYRNGSTPPQFLSPGSIPNDFEKEEERLLSELSTMCCISDLSTNSSVPGNINSGSALTLLIEQDESRLSLVAEHIRFAIKNIATKIIRLYKQFAGLERLSKANDSNGVLEIFYWKNSDLTSDDIYLETENELQDSIESQKQAIFTLFDKGILCDNNGKLSPSNKLKILDMFGFKNWEIYSDINETHKERAINENLGLIELDQPLEIDNHEIHIEEHSKHIISDFKNQIKPEFKSKLLEHINNHKNMMKQ